MAKEKYRLAIDKVRVDRGDHQQEFTRGDVLEDIPEGTLEAMLRLGQAVSSADYVEQPMADEEVEEEETTIDWRDTPIADLGFDPPINDAFSKAGLATVRDALEFGMANGDSLVSLEGIGDKTNEKFTAIVSQLAAGS